MIDTNYIPWEALEAGLDEVRRSPQDQGRLELIVRRPRSNKRDVLAEGELDLSRGLVGDCWRPMNKGDAPEANQLTIMNSRAIALIAGGKDRWPPAGDQLYIDLDLSEENLPPGMQLLIGAAVIEITPLPHTGCGKFKARFGRDALKFVNSPV
ncbi:MAG: MOSC domain-containing protein, partial [Planctomycetes bacterium]|nr:MOSC domain-containing protein [Planctomycetota bacterium]